MELVTSFELVLQSLSPVMTAPSFQSWLTLVTGWIFARRHTVTQMIVAAGAVEGKHFSSFHRFFSHAAWSRDELGLAVLALLQPWLGTIVYLGVDDTLARKRGLKMFGTGMHLDPLLSSRGYKVAGLRLTGGAAQSHWLPVTKDAASGENELIIHGFPKGTAAVSVWITEMNEKEEPKFGSAVIKTESVQMFKDRVRVCFRNNYDQPLPVGAMILYG